MSSLNWTLMIADYVEENWGFAEKTESVNACYFTVFLEPGEGE